MLFHLIWFWHQLHLCCFLWLTQGPIIFCADLDAFTDGEHRVLDDWATGLDCELLYLITHSLRASTCFGDVGHDLIIVPLNVRQPF